MYIFDYYKYLHSHYIIISYNYHGCTYDLVYYNYYRHFLNLKRKLFLFISLSYHFYHCFIIRSLTKKSTNNGNP